MALTKEDLQAIGELMDSKLEAVKTDMAQMIKQELEPVNARLEAIEGNQTSANERLNAIEGRQAAFSKDMARHNHVVELLVKIIAENIEDITGRGRQVDRLGEQIEAHDHRIWALEQLAVANK